MHVGEQQGPRTTKDFSSKRKGPRKTTAHAYLLIINLYPTITVIIKLLK
jgi:hypothetical protein